MATELEVLRLDKWLWAARFFKTRALAVTAIKGGKVHLNGKRIKPSRVVNINDLLEITRGNVAFIVNVTGLNDKRRPAKEAQLLYEETEESKKEREAIAERRRLEARSVKYERRPDKKQRRKIHQFKRRESS